EGNLNWNQLKDIPKLEKIETNNTESLTYAIDNSNWAWTNIDKFDDDPRDKTNIYVKLPNGFNSTNTHVYIVFEGTEAKVALLENVTNEGFFTDGYGLVPIGSNVHIVAISYTQNGWLSAVKFKTINGDDVIEI